MIEVIEKGSDTDVASQKVNSLSITAEQLGAASFRKRYAIKYAYLAGSMYRGISSKELLITLGKAQLLVFWAQPH